MNKTDKIEYAQLLEERIRRNKLTQGIRTYLNLYPFQNKFINATKIHTACMLMSANQVGKSLTGCTADSFHLTGEYPDNWGGHKFTSPPMCWLLGYSGEKTRDLLQLKLFGRFQGGKFEGGLVSGDKITDWRSMTGTAGAMREVRVKHVNGTATCQFWSYSQGQHALMGDDVEPRRVGYISNVACKERAAQVKPHSNRRVHCYESSRHPYHEGQPLRDSPSSLYLKLV